MWLENKMNNFDNTLTECEIADYIDNCRYKQPLNKGLRYL